MVVGIEAYLSSWQGPRPSAFDDFRRKLDPQQIELAEIARRTALPVGNSAIGWSALGLTLGLTPV